MIVIPRSIFLVLKFFYLYYPLKKFYVKYLKYSGLLKNDIETLLFVKSLTLFKNNFFIDVGCFEGSKIDVFLNIDKKLKILALEPFKKYYKNLKKKYQNKKNIKILNFAASDKNKKNNFYFNNKKIDKEAFSLIKNKKLNKKLTINCKKIDNYKKKNPTIIKIDTEGAEVQVLIGCKNILHNQKTIFFIEVTNNTLSKISKILKANNYIFFIYEYNFFKKKINNMWKINNVISNN